MLSRNWNYKLTVCMAISFVMSVAAVNAQQLAAIKLNAPNKSRGTLSVMQALAARQSAAEYSDRLLSVADMSDLFWAADGINREDGRRTAASAMNAQDVILYAFTPQGVYLYDAGDHELKPVVAGDHRTVFGERGMAPLIVLMVSDVAKFGDRAALDMRREFGAIDVGIVAQNIMLFCSGNGLCTRPRAGMDREAITKLLNLNDSQLPMLNNAIGYPKN